MDKPQKWIKVPGPGEFRGEGEWCKVEDVGCTEADWEHIQRTGWLPVYEGEAPPVDNK